MSSLKPQGSSSPRRVLGFSVEHLSCSYENTLLTDSQQVKSGMNKMDELATSLYRTGGRLRYLLARVLSLYRPDRVFSK